MSEKWHDGTKAERAALAVNRVICELVHVSRQGDVIKDRCRVSVVGYGERVERVVDNMISDVASCITKVKKIKKSIPDGRGGNVEVDVEMPIWLQPKASNGTPMHEAFEHAAEIVQGWCSEWPDGFPPIVLNITDGAADDPALTALAAKKVMDLHTGDGNALVFNFFIGANRSTVILPQGTAELAGDCLAEFLFNISSVLPEPLREAAIADGIPAEPGARCFGYNAEPATTVEFLNFGSKVKKIYENWRFEMEYSNVPIGTSNPGCIIILVDQSWSMGEEWGTETKSAETKSEGAALAVNRILYELVLAARAGGIIKDRCHVSVIGYGEQVACIVDGMISEVASSVIEVKKMSKSISDGAGGIVEEKVEMPIWLYPESNNGTPMHEAFERAAEIIQNWCEDKPDGFPPIVINVTDGAANFPELTAVAARKVMNLHTKDGNVLVFNIHIANNKHEVVFPHSTSQLTGDDLAEFLFELSSELPEPLREEARRHGLPAEPDTRCFAYNAGPITMIKILNFGSTTGLVPV